jgi:hypothetical protein
MALGRALVDGHDIEIWKRERVIGRSGSHDNDRSMRHFAADCLKCAEETPDPGHRQTVVDAARTWARTAAAIDRYDDRVLTDLRNKLN